MRSAVFDPSSTMKTSKKVVKALKGRDAVLLKDNGALCCGPSKSDAQATEMVMDKAANHAGRRFIRYCKAYQCD